MRLISENERERLYQHRDDVWVEETIVEHNVTVPGGFFRVYQNNMPVFNTHYDKVKNEHSKYPDREKAFKIVTKLVEAL